MSPFTSFTLRKRCPLYAAETSLSGRFRLALFHQGINSLVQELATHILVADHALGVQHVDRRVGPDIQVGNDVSVWPIEPVHPRHRFLLQELGEGFALLINTDA